MLQSLRFGPSMAGFFIIALFLQTAMSDAADQSSLPSIRPGQMFPQFSGQTLTGKSLELPAAAMGKPAVVVFSFTKAAGMRD